MCVCVYIYIHIIYIYTYIYIYIYILSFCVSLSNILEPCHKSKKNMQQLWYQRRFFVDLEGMRFSSEIPLGFGQRFIEILGAE